MKDKISIIVPVYNVEKYIDRCLESIINQTYKNLQIILIDDGSPDNCGKICDEYALRDSRIEVIHKANGGVASARNAGLDIADGEYIGFVDSDDWLEKDMYEFLEADIKKYNADIAMCGCVTYEHGEIISAPCDGKVYEFNNVEYRKKVVCGEDYGFIWNKIYKRSIVGDIRFDTAYGCSEDLIFNYYTALKVDKIIFEDRAKYNYYRIEGGITKGEFGEGAFGVIDVMQKILEAERGTEVYESCIKGYTNSAYVVLSGIITNEKCLDRYDELRNSILKYKKQILFGKYHNKMDRLKLIILWVSPYFYNKIIKNKKNKK